MKSSLLLIGVCFLFFGAELQAQTIVSGTVLDETGTPIEGVRVIVKDTRMGAFTDQAGSFEVQVPEGATQLVFSYLGKKTIERPIADDLNALVLVNEDLELDEIVITALNIKRKERSLGYAVQEITGEQVTRVRDQNVVSALSGKISGVQVLSASGANLGGSATIRIRGIHGLYGGSPLFVVDGTPISDDNDSGGRFGGVDIGNLAQDINPDDIESISVLKGLAATALYGSRAANGVVLINTHKGTSREGLGINISSSISFENVYIMPEYQNEYAGGYTQDYLRFTDPVDGKEYNTLNYAADESWGPPIDGTTLYRPWWSWYPGTADYGTQIPMTAHPNNVRDFFRTGMTYNNSVSFSGGGEETNFRLSYNNVNQTSVFPTGKLARNNLSFQGKTHLTDRFTVSANVYYANNRGIARPELGYSEHNPLASFNMWMQRQLDTDRLKDYRQPGGLLRTWNIRGPLNLRPRFWDSPYFSVSENFALDSRDRVFGDVTLAYQITDHLLVKGITRTDFYTQRLNTRVATGGLLQDSYSDRVYNFSTDYYEFLMQYQRDVGPISVHVNLGGEIREEKGESNYMATRGGLTAPNLFNISASRDRPVVSNNLFEKKVRSLYGGGTIGFKDMVYIDATARNDWSSTLPKHRNSYLYPSIAGSFILSELWNEHRIFSFAKLRVSWARVGSDTGPYLTNLTYDTGRPYGTTATFSVPNATINDSLRPAQSSSYELGLDARLFRNRVGIDVSYYKTRNIDQILFIQVPGSSGFNSAFINAGNITSEGVDLSLRASPVRGLDFSWDLVANLAKNTSRVVELADGVENQFLSGFFYGLSFNARAGEEWGMMRGTAFKRFQAEDSEGNLIEHPSNGKIMIHGDGTYQQDRNQNLGSVLPDFTGGFSNTFRYKGVELHAFIDFQAGGMFTSVTQYFSAYSGLSPLTVGMNDKGNPMRDPIDEGGGIRVDGVLEDGSDHTVYANPQAYWQDLANVNERWLFDASYVKFRELSLGYTLPDNLLSKLPMDKASLAFFIKNVWLIHANIDGFDPSERVIGRDTYGFVETGGLPSVRSLGINVKLGF